MPCWRCTSAKSSSICWRRLTSNAVVGSSASNKRGALAKAMAIMARWRWPPLSWCGKDPARRAASAMPVLANSATAAARACAASMPFFRRSTSAICSPTAYSGLSAVMGSWKIMAMSSPRTPRISRSLNWLSSRPSNSAEPVTCASGNKRKMDKAETVLPDPDSPTMAHFSPARMSTFKPCTTGTPPKDTRQSRSCNRAGSVLIGLAFGGRARRARRRP